MEEIVKMIGYCTVGVVLIMLIFRIIAVLGSIATSPIGLFMLFLIAIGLLKIGKKM